MLATSTTLGCGLSLYLAVWASDVRANAAAPAASQVYQFGGWTMTITPGPVAAKAPLTAAASPASAQQPLQLTSFTRDDVLPMPPSPAEAPAAAAAAPPFPSAATAPPARPAADSSQLVQRYRDVYDAIPFSRAEYEANPSYRHDATLEFLFGQLRPTVIQRGSMSVNVNEPAGWSFGYSPYVYYGQSGWYGPVPAPGYRVYRGW